MTITLQMHQPLMHQPKYEYACPFGSRQATASPAKQYLDATCKQPPPLFSKSAQSLHQSDVGEVKKAGTSESALIRIGTKGTKFYWVRARKIVCRFLGETSMFSINPMWHELRVTQTFFITRASEPESLSFASL